MWVKPQWDSDLTTHIHKKKKISKGHHTAFNHRYMGSWPTLSPFFIFAIFFHTLLNIILVSNNHKSTISFSLYWFLYHFVPFYYQTIFTIYYYRTHVLFTMLGHMYCLLCQDTCIVYYARTHVFFTMLGHMYCLLC